MPELYPLTFTPVYKHYLWGGHNLAQFGRQLPNDPRPIAESWEISAHPNGQTPVNNGAYRGQTLTQLIDTLGEALLGHHNSTALTHQQFPLLIKLLDCHRPLSVQVHPTASYARQQGHPTAPKSEMWYVLNASPNAQIIYGLEPGTTRQQLKTALDSGQSDDAPLNQLLHYRSVKAGDAILVPSGTLHALLGGLVIVEIQQTADTTYRLHDWGRVDTNGQPRDLHIDHALAVIDFDHPTPEPFHPQRLAAPPEHTTIAHCDHFTVERLTLHPGEQFDATCDGSTFEIWLCISGHATLTWSGPPLEMAAIQTCLLPASLGNFTLSSTRPTTLLRAYIPRP